MKKSLLIFLGIICLSIGNAAAQQWRSHLAYNNVSQIALTPEHVYAVSDGSLFSVNKLEETITAYDRLSGLHFSDIERIGYDDVTKSLLIIYQLGRIDLMSSSGVKAVLDYFNKDITADKHVNNITFRDGNAYLATEFGVLRFNLRNTTFMECCYIGENATEMSVKDIQFKGDSIYALTENAVYVAHLNDNILDYRFWHPTSTSIEWNKDKGIRYTDTNGEIWLAGGADGLIRVDNQQDSIPYMPNGPAVNQCYRIRHAGNKIGMVPGTYAVEFGNRPGAVMLMEDGRWTNFDATTMKTLLGRKSEDYCDIAFDPTDPSHFYVASFGYGLIEFRNNQFYHHYTHANSPLEPCFEGGGFKYVWVDGLTYDADGNLWMTNVSENGIKVLTKDSTWISFSNVACKNLARMQDLIVSNTNSHIIITSCINVGLGVMDNNGTLEDQSDDRAVYLTSLKGAHGEDIVLNRIWTIFQSSNGALWIGTDDGLLRIDQPADILENTYTCTDVRLDLEAEGLTDVFNQESVNCIEEDQQHRIWIGTQTSGLYCISEDFSKILYHYTGSNSPLISNVIHSLHYVPAAKTLYIGTGAGLMAHKDSTEDGGTDHLDEDEDLSYGSMKGWTTHFSYNMISSIEESSQKIYGISNGALLAIDKNTEEIEPQSKLTGLNGANIVLMAYNKPTDKTLLLYRNGLIDIISHDEEVHSMPDLFLKTQLSPSEFYSTYSYGDHVYICSQLGIIRVNMRREEISETYMLRDTDQDLTIHAVCVANDSIYAATERQIYKAALSANLIDYSNWDLLPTSFDKPISSLCGTNEGLYILSNSTLYLYQGGTWKTVMADVTWQNIYAHNGTLIGLANDKLYEVTASSCELLSDAYAPKDILRSGNDYWMALPEQGIVRWNAATGLQAFETNSPFENLCYRIRITSDKLIMLPGGYFASNYERNGNVMVRENQQWKNYTYHYFEKYYGGIPRDFCDAAIDPKDPSHFFIASFGNGLFEFRNNKWYTHYSARNTVNGLESYVEGQSGYTWVDGLSIDEEGNLWMLNNSQNGVKVLMKNGQWVRYNNVATRDLNRTQDLLIWNKNPHIKIVTCARVGTGVGVFDDNGTIDYTGDDKAVFFSSFVDQNNKTVAPDYIFSICQLEDGTVWVGTEQGIIVLPDVSKLLKRDNSCRRIIIPRNDGTGLGDYLLGDERINCMAVDGGNRVWIGTGSSGLYLVSSDGQQTFEHFTSNNSPLVSDGIYALAIHPYTGEVFVGTSIGLMAYQSDANDPQEDMDAIYAYPNPVPANYAGYISITGLMENTTVNIIDEGGNLVCKTRSNGGMAVWDGCDAYGRRAVPGIYTALCNANGKHKTCKILILHATR